MKLALRLLTLALCVFAGIENWMLTHPGPCRFEKPSAVILQDPVFHQQSSAGGSDLTGGKPTSNGIGGGILDPSVRSGRDYSNAGSPADSHIWIETVSIGGEFLPNCPAGRTCS